jgi:DNA-binding LacI/PurR family transcriptional regulator
MDRTRSQLGAKAPTLAFLVDLLEDGYQSAITNGVLRGAHNAGATVVCFAGGIVGSQENSAPQRNHVFDLAAPANVDAVIVLGGTLVNQVGTDALARFCERYRPMPLCSVGAPLAGMPSVLINNEVGMRSVIEHLISVHGFRRIAFVRGPEANAEAELRLGIYREVLERHAIAFDANLVANGDFRLESGRAAVACLLDERRLRVEDLDAIVVSNDNMAFGVLDELKARGIRVPTDIAVTGFDDVEEARYRNPGLTTVRQPLEEQGKEAVRMVLLHLQRKRPEASVTVAAELVLRGSCGCNEREERSPDSALDNLSLSFEATLISRRQRMMAELARAARGNLVSAGPNWEMRLISAFAEELRGENPGAAARFFESVVDGFVESGLDTTLCHTVLDTLRHEMLACLRKEPERRTQAENLFQDLRLVIARTTERHLGASRLHLEQWARQLSVIGARLIGTFDMNDLRIAVATNLPLLGLASCFVVLYDGEGAPATFSKLVLGYDRHVELTAVADVQFATDALLPPEVADRSRERKHVVIAPLFFKQEVFGYLVVDLDVRQAFAYEAIRDLISAAIKGAMLIRVSKQQSAELSSALDLIRQQELQKSELVNELQELVHGIESGTIVELHGIRERLETLIVKA